MTMTGRFIEQLRRSQSETSSSFRGTQQLRYRLDPEAGRLGLQLEVVDVAPNGRVETAVPYRLQPAHLHRPPPFLTGVDRELLERLHRNAPDWLQASAGILPGSLDLDWLRRLLGTGRVLDPDGVALGWAEPVAAGCSWRVDPEGGCQRLAWQLPDALLPLPTATPGYWDRATGCCGEIHSDYPPEARAWLTQASALAPDSVSDFLGREGARLASWGLPLPRVLPRRRVRAAATGLLRLFSRTPALPGSCDRMRLLFRYAQDDFAVLFAADEIAKERTVVVPERAERITFQRDPDGEQALRERLQEALAGCGSRTLDDGDIGLAESRAWIEVMTGVLPRLRGEGWRVEVDPGFRQHWVRPDAIEVDTGWLDRDWFELALRIELDGEPIALLPLLARLRGQYPLSELGLLDPEQEIPLPLEDGRQVLLPAGRVLNWLRVFAELENADSTRERLRLPAAQIARLAQLDDGATRFGAAGTALLQRAAALRAGVAVEDFRPPPGLQAELRGYQRLGVAWLQQRQRLGLGGVLADDMGLGKTLQVLAHLMLERTAGRLQPPALVVAPTSVLGNWLAEARRFCPELQVLLLHGPDRQKQWAAVDRCELVITSYSVFANDLDHWRTRELSGVFLDEAQAIRNPRTRIHQGVRELRASARFCLTGTPLQNHLGDLWALFDFLLPGCLDSEAQFRRRYRRPIEDEGDTLRAQGLFERIAPFLLRRTKSEVAADLPGKTEVTLRLPLQGAQREFYELLRQRSVAQLHAAGSDTGPERLNVLNALLQLRQVCCDPRLVDAERYRETGSAKREYLLWMLQELVEEGRVILVFSQFRRMLELIAGDLIEAGIEHRMLTGRTRDRQAVIDGFQNGAGQVFLISLKAGGTGLNLTRADTVIHYDPWWNDAAESQATDRAYRIGQTQPVFVYRLLAEDTVEERVHALQARKRGQLEAVYTAAEQQSERLRLTQRELLKLLEVGR
jgi:superfamily II DNA or RNA helicase